MAPRTASEIQSARMPAVLASIAASTLPAASCECGRRVPEPYQEVRTVAVAMIAAAGPWGLVGHELQLAPSWGSGTARPLPDSEHARLIVVR